ncbi:hypothetical protein RHMOL_Rhmol05G0311100 [Rhododendron molle]|uniref:Uncharacterized protein n=1 Tax=Rhododendron molle TaxID=49168 RepID=A0ACC0NV26_RHOML|nr:hypothetical protein RHMOL_Rhmol05G0311100 [Rhododendron molle]
MDNVLRNVSVVLREECDMNMIRFLRIGCLRDKNAGIVIREGRDLETAQGKSKEKDKLVSASKGKENAFPVGTNGSTISKAALAQRKRRERERSGKIRPSYQSGQRLRRARDRALSCHQPIKATYFPSLTPTCRDIMDHGAVTVQQPYKRQMVSRPSCSIFAQSTSWATQNERSTPDNQIHEEQETAMELEVGARSHVNSYPLNLTHEENLCSEEEVDMPVELEVDARARVNSCRHFLGKMDVVCPFCKALHWMDEKLVKSSKKNPLFGTYCLQGKVKLPLLMTPPPPIQALYDGNDDRSKSFRAKTRVYNAANAFTSLGATLDARILSGRGPTSFTIHGELRHRTGSLMPLPNQEASYAQLYIYDPNSALDIRNRRNPKLRRDVLGTIQDSLLQVNPFVGKFRQAHAILNQLAEREQSLPAHLHYSPSTDRRRYNLPTADEIAVIIPGDGTKASGLRDIILHLRGNNGLMRINECHPAYLSLHYVLLFPQGELGWGPDFKQWDVSNDEASTDRLTQLQFYSHRLFERRIEYSTILRGGKLFQEFLVDAWASTEQNRLTFYKMNQGKLRVELYKELKDIGPDELGPNQIGKRVVLPSSFTGGPRHMFEIFQDSMAITRYNHHPDIFLTMTANPSWPEIIAALLPHQKSIDRPDLIARVFELKRKALMKEIETNKVFGKKVAHVFTIEYQKRGLPHMHELTFLGGPDKIRTCAQVPAVVRLEVHLPGMHRCIYNPSESLETIRARGAHQQSTLTAFFSWYASNEDAPKYTYQEFPQHFTWNKTSKIWTPRVSGFAIGRMYFASPNYGERFYLRLLLTVVKGPTSFECLRTVENVVHHTFKEACVARGLLEDDDEWVQCLQEAAVMKTGYQLRRLFSIILMQCSPIHPYALWKQFSVHICDDLAYKIRTLFAISNPSEAQIEDYGLYLLNHLLQESGKTLLDFPPMPQPNENWSAIVGNRLILEHRQLQIEAQQAHAPFNVHYLNSGQNTAYNAITSSVFENKGTMFFLNGGAGTGKTFLYNTIAGKCRSLGHIVVSVASSGIASLLLTGGRTAHSTFCIPLDVMEDSFCGFKKQSIQAELFRETKLIIWDEVPMQHRYCVEAIDRTLRDICDNDKPFGGITIVLGGDFRQILPVVTRGSREQIVNASLRRSTLWKEIVVLTLDVNMRLDQADSGNANFAAFLNEVGTIPQGTVKLPSTIHKCRDLNELLSTVYPQLDVVDASTPTFLTERTILSARNEDVNAINAAALNIFPGDAISYLAADKMSEDDEVDQTIANRYPNEYLNSLDPTGLPPFKDWDEKAMDLKEEQYDINNTMMET